MSGAHPVVPGGTGEPQRFPTLDGVRFLAFFAVFLSHVVPVVFRSAEQRGLLDFLPFTVSSAAKAGGFGVDLFLVLSSFLLTTLLLIEHEATGTISVRWFYVRRMLRIWPLYLSFLAAMYLVSRLDLHVDKFQPIATGYWEAFVALVGNWYSGLHGSPNSAIDPLWSVSLEEQFYLFWPWLLLLFRRHLKLVCGAMIGLSVLSRVIVVYQGLPDLAMWMFTVTRFDPIALGALIALAGRSGRLPRWSPATQWTIVLVGFAAWPVVQILFPLDHATYGAALVSFPIGAITSAGILIAAVTSTASLRSFLTRPWIVHLGSLSYGTYVLHYAALAVTAFVLKQVLHGSAVIAILYPVVGFLLTWGAAELSYRFLESRFLALRPRFRRVGPAMAKSVPGPAPAPRLQDTPGSEEGQR